MDKMVSVLMGIGALFVIIGASVFIFGLVKLFKKRKGLKSLPSKFLFFILVAAIGSSLFYLGLFFQTFSRYTAEEKIGWIYAESDSTTMRIIYYDEKKDSTHSFVINGDEWMIEGKLY